jgi:hypothetical protein
MAALASLKGCVSPSLDPYIRPELNHLVKPTQVAAMTAPAAGHGAEITGKSGRAYNNRNVARPANTPAAKTTEGRAGTPRPYGWPSA